MASVPYVAESLSIARHGIEAPPFQSAFAVLDPVEPRRDEVPQNVARSIQDRAADQHESKGLTFRIAGDVCIWA
jgi:hypothetical protein